MLKSFKFFASYLEAACELNAKDRGDFLYAVVQYGINGEEVPLKKSLRPLWLVVKPNLDNSRKYQISGEKGGKHKKAALKKSESPLSENEEPDKDKNMDKDKDMEENQQQPTATPAAVTPPQGRSGGKALLDSGLENSDRDAATEAARQQFLNSITRPAWPAADAAAPDVLK